MDAAAKPADTRTPQQKTALRRLLMELRNLYPQASIVGHRDLSYDRNYGDAGYLRQAVPAPRPSGHDPGLRQRSQDGQSQAEAAEDRRVPEEMMVI